MLDQIMMENFGIHSLEPRAVKVPITRVVVDQNAPFKSPRRSPVIKGRQSTSAMKVNQSISSIGGMGSPKVNESLSLTPQKKRQIFSSPGNRSPKRKAVPLGAELQLAVAQARFEDRAVYQECAEVLEVVFRAVE